MKRILLILPEGWNPSEVWVCTDRHVTEPILADKDLLEVAPKSELGVPGEFLAPHEGVTFTSARIKTMYGGIGK